MMSLAPAVAEDRVFINDDAKQPLKMMMLEPWYRQTVYSTLPIKEVKLELYPSIHINPAALQGSSINIEVINVNNIIAARVVQSNLPLSSLSIRKNVRINGLAFGRYRVVARMFDSLGKPLTDVFGNPCEAQTPLFIAPPAPQEVVFDQNAVCRVNGKPFFPIAMYHYEAPILDLANALRAEKKLGAFSREQWYLDARKMGINAVHDDFNSGDEKSLNDMINRGELMHRSGLRTLANPPNYKKYKESQIQLLSRNPGLLGWYTFDEPQQFGGSYVEELVAPTYARLKEIDPYHPQFICDIGLTAATNIRPYTDVLMPDLYPQRDGDMRIVGKAVTYLKNLNGGRTVVWPVIQAFQLPNYAKKPDGNLYTFGRLTYKEMRALVFDAIACGATGISYYAYYTSEGPQILPDGSKRSYYMLDDYPDQRHAITIINKQLHKLVPAVISGEIIDTSIRPSNSDAHVRAFKKDGQCYLLVANPDRESIDIRIGIMGMSSQTGMDLYSSKKVQLADGHFNLKLKPLDVYVFMFAYRSPK